jgi:hypothetical protein
MNKQSTTSEPHKEDDQPKNATTAQPSNGLTTPTVHNIISNLTSASAQRVETNTNAPEAGNTTKTRIRTTKPV